MKPLLSSRSPVLLWPSRRAVILDGAIRLALLAFLLFGFLSLRDKFNNTVLLAAALGPALLIVMPFVMTLILLAKQKPENRP